ncbi:hypothetical protein [Flavihumibacter fluvii]|uniref:hypothetical protein n=1 Tax=Flavihumibacter fluvii TaxID=2838157 RepID=UPI001BDE638E|nr:hypothetical protein [Flavihumibacter fluvii]ULQ54502.1 hypothetical protein KJS93_09240 [Flavihumibacter fluvii]
MSTEDPFFFDRAFEADDDEMASLQLENDIMKLKMQAEFGAVFGSTQDIPPSLEKEFLENILAFEEMGKNAVMITVYELLGRPAYVPAQTLTDERVQDELDKLLKLMEAHDLSLVLLYEYPPLLIYTFITEELFQEEIEDIRMPGMLGVFVYENFHPKHESLIEQLTIEFLEGWRDLHWADINNLLYYVGVLPDDRVIQEEEMIRIIERETDRYESMQLFEFNITNIQFEWKEGNVGLGFSEGILQTMVLPKKGAPAYLKGEFRCYYCNTDGYWRLTFFCLPGFEWD